MKRITGAEARELAAKATQGEWEAAEIQDGTQAGEEICVVVLNDARAYRKPDGTWHGVYICRGMDGPTRGPNAALIAAAPDLAATVCEVTAERDALRTRLALHEAFVSALDAHEEALHALECATSATFAALYEARACAWERAHAAREALREAAPRDADWHLEPDERAF